MAGELVKNCRYYQEMKAILALLILDGISLGFISASVSKILPSPEDKIETGVFLIVLGVGSALGSYFSGIFSDRFQIVNVGRSAVILVLASILFTFFALKVNNLWLANISGFLWGFSVLYLEGWVYVVCSVNYNGNLAAYANSKQIHSLSFCVYQIFLIMANGQIELEYLLLVMILMSGPAFYTLRWLVQLDHYFEPEEDQIST